jgi:hypothetical protein
MATQLAHRMHQPQEVPLGDIGFTYLPVSPIFVTGKRRGRKRSFAKFFFNYSAPVVTHSSLLKRSHAQQIFLYYF